MKETHRTHTEGAAKPLCEHRAGYETQKLKIAQFLRCQRCHHTAQVVFHRAIGVELQPRGELGPWSVTERKWEEREGYWDGSGEGLSVDPRALSNPTDFQTQSVLSSSVCLD